MRSHENRSQGTTGRRGRDLIAHLIGVDIGRIESLSWPLGDRITTGTDANRMFGFAHRLSARTVTAFEVADGTCVLRLRTPVGREKFYAIADVDLATRPARDGWVRTD